LTNFSDFGFATPILQALAAEGYETPTPIQAQAIPHALAGRDLCGIAQTGTGKTAAFALPILQRLSDSAARRAPRTCRALVLSPTRELSSQIADSFRAYGRQLRLSTAVVFGGVSLFSQQRLLAPGVDILVATPGRLLDLIERRDLSLSNVEVLVLDEADRMLDLGFIHALRRIVKLLPRDRQTLLFSATMPRAIASLAEDYLNDPVKVAVAPVATTAERVEQKIVFVTAARKRDLLSNLLAAPELERVLVFTRTKHGADRVVRHLDDCGVEAAAIHGNKSQPQRERALAGFRAGRTRVLVATDIASRGIDVEAVSHVINFELPNVPEDYVHRIGRTARAGAAGIAISFCSDDERPYLRDIEKLTRLKLPVLPLPADLPATSRAEAPERRPEHPGARAPNRSGPRPNGGRNAAPRPNASQGNRQEMGSRPSSRPAASNGHPPAPANRAQPALASGHRAPANDGGLPAFLHRDGADRRSSRGPWRPRGSGRGGAGRAASPR
jgi:ATP-dependent RNA helicase RhlE